MERARRAGRAATIFVASTLAVAPGAARAQRLEPGAAHARSTDVPVTFNADVAPILFARCATCHRPGGAAFSLLTYEDAKARARLIATVTRNRFMPPWRPEPEFGRFAGERRLSDQEIEVIGRWSEEGSREGDPAARPLVPTWTSEWRLGEPDVVIAMPEPYTLSAAGDDVYRNFVIPIGLSGRRYVKAWEFRPGNSKVVHHATLHVDPTPSSRLLDAQDPEPGYEGVVAHAARTPDGFFLDWAPGHTPAAAADGMAWPIETGSDLVMMLHLRPSGRPEEIQASVGLYFSRDAPSRLPVMLRLNREDLDIAQGERSYTVTDSYMVPVDVDAYTVQPHAHYLAREVKSVATLPDGSTERLISIKDWAFDWQDVYHFERPVFLPAGTTVSMEWRYDNSKENVRNPNQPPRRVVYGQRTSDEMCELWLQVVPRHSDDRGLLARSIRAKVLPQEIRGFETMVRADPDNAALHDDAALLYLEAGNLKQSAAQFAESLRLRPLSAAAHYNLGTALLALGDHSSAATSLRKALTIDPGYGRAHYNLAVALHSLGDLDDAAAQYLEAIRVDPSSAEAHRGAALVLQLQKKPGEAVRHLRDALRISPDWPPALLSLAWILGTSADDRVRAPAESLRLADLAAAGQPPDVTNLDVLAAAYAATGQFERAVAAAERAHALAAAAGRDATAAAIRSRMDSYRDHKPYREP